MPPRRPAQPAIRLVVLVEPDVYEQLRQQAGDQHISMSEFVRQAIAEKLATE